MNGLYAYFVSLIAAQIGSGGWLYYILTQDEPSIWQSGTLALVMILPIGLELGGLMNIYWLWQLYNQRLNHPVLSSLFALLMPIWLALIVWLLTGLLFIFFA